MFWCYCSRLTRSMKVSVSFTKTGVWWTFHVHGDLTFYSHAGVSIQGKFFHFFYKHAKGQAKRRLGFIEKGRKMGESEPGRSIRGRVERKAQDRRIR